MKIIIADDHALFSEGIKGLLAGEPGIEILDIVSDGLELLDILRKSQPDIILLDINMPRLNGLEAAKKIRTYYPNIKIVMLSTYDDQHLIQKAIEYNVEGYLVKTVDKEELLLCMIEVIKGNKFFPLAANKKEQNTFDRQDVFLKQFNLTKREYEILQLIKQGFTNQQIAEKLFLSIYTVETHRKNTMQKLGLNSPAGLMKFIIENNI
jgi:two-component system, NarL family, nitrate/nitrite response regulator NarL